MLKKSAQFIASVLLLAASGFAFRVPRLSVYKGSNGALRRARDSRDLISNCRELYRIAVLDHFSWHNPATFKQRYFVCDKYIQSSSCAKPPTIFFYVGNEADVTLYLNHTGLMWENAPKFGALLVFAEHRYYGKSLPFPKESVKKHMHWLTAEQAMADYADLITELKEKYCPNSAVIGFGGSYGGMLASWFRMKYPHLMDGAIAGSAPIWNFLGEDPAYEEGGFARAVTFDATPEAGSATACVPNARRGWQLLLSLGNSTSGRSIIRRAARLCEGVALDSLEDVLELREWLSGAWDYMAMGDYPYESSYILNGDGTLPPFPVSVACEHLQQEDLQGEHLVEGLVAASGVFYNHSGDVECFNYRQGANNETDDDSNFWDWQFCTEMFMPMSRDGVADMFWPQPFDTAEAVRSCRQQWGVEPSLLHATTEWGGRRIAAASNIVFSNGVLDPWRSGGVTTNLSDSLLAITIDKGAHHLDLMFSHPKDPASVKRARLFELSNIERWISEAHQRQLAFVQNTSKFASFVEQ